MYLPGNVLIADRDRDTSESHTEHRHERLHLPLAALYATPPISMKCFHACALTAPPVN